MKHCFFAKRLAIHSFGGLEDSGLSFSASPSAVVYWKVDEAQSMPLKASNSASSSINPVGSTSGAKVCLRIGGTRLVTLNVALESSDFPRRNPAGAW